MPKTYTAISLYIAKNAAPHNRQSTLQSKKMQHHRVDRVLWFFLQSSELGPTPSTAGECVPSPFGSPGGTHSLAGKGVVGGSNSDEGTDNVAL
jgi:hypothetical protein